MMKSFDESTSDVIKNVRWKFSHCMYEYRVVLRSSSSSVVQASTVDYCASKLLLKARGPLRAF